MFPLMKGFLWRIRPVRNHYSLRETTLFDVTTLTIKPNDYYTELNEQTSCILSAVQSTFSACKDPNTKLKRKYCVFSSVGMGMRSFNKGSEGVGVTMV